MIRYIIFCIALLCITYSAWSPIIIRKVSAAAGYTAYAATFDGTDWLQRDAELTSNADGPRGSMSFWINFNGGDSSRQDITMNQNYNISLYKHTDNNLLLTLTGTDADMKVRFYQDGAKVNPLTNGSGWAWVAFSWDNTSGGSTSQFYINGTEAMSSTLYVYDQDDVDIDYTRGEHLIGSAYGVNDIDACLSEVWINWTNVDWSVSANRDKFYNAGSPVDLGSDGSTPGFGQPIIYLKDPYDSFTDNSGYGGNMVLKGGGALTECTAP